MAVVGRACLILAFAAALYGVGAALYGARTGNRAFAESARRAVYALAGLITAAFVILEIAFLRSDFSFVTVATHSSTTTPFFYKAAAAWSSQEGSLLLWVLLLSIWSSLVLIAHAPPPARRRRPTRPPSCSASARSSSGCWCSRRRRSTRTRGAAPAEGTGLNPLLRHPSMMIHPIALYSGYTLCGGAVRVRDRRADRAAHRRGVDRARRGASRWRAGWRSASACCSARAGPTWSWAGAATGPGTRSRTPRCCRG